MAKADDIDDGFVLLGSEFLRGQLEILCTQVQGVRANTDVEFVHQVRVASRRMRAGLDFFGEIFGSKTCRRWQKSIKRLTKGLGAARDADVQTVFVESLVAGLSKVQEKRYGPGLKRLVLRLRQEREKAQPQVVAVLDGLEQSGVLAEMQAVLDKRLKRLHKRQTGVDSECVFEQARCRIGRQREQLFSWESVLADADNRAGHHQMRIAAKRLRYTLEICQRAYGKRLKPFIRRFKGLQTLLGDLHDCDVRQAWIAVFMEEELERTRVYFGDGRAFGRLRPGLEFVRDSEVQRRSQLFGQLVQLWGQFKEETFWDTLADVVEQRR